MTKAEQTEARANGLRRYWAKKKAVKAKPKRTVSRTAATNSQPVNYTQMLALVNSICKAWLGQPGDVTIQFDDGRVVSFRGQKQ